MKKWLLALGANVLLIGLLVSSYSNVPEDRIEHVCINKVLNDWEVSGNFSENEKLLVFLAPNMSWAWYADEPYDNFYTGFFTVKINVTDPLKRVTEFKVIFRATTGQIEPSLSIWAFELISNQGALVVEANPGETLHEIGGSTKVNGTYIASVGKGAFYPPRQLSLYKETLRKEYPRSFLLPIGIGIIVAGLSLSASSMIISKRRVKRKKALRSRGK